MRENCVFLLDEKEEKWYDSSMENTIEINRKIAKNLTHYRKAAGLTQVELAEKINYSDKSISKWESGNGVPDIYTLIQLAEVFGVTVDALIGEKAPVIGQEKPVNMHWLIMLLASGIVWLVATCFFVLMQLIAPGRDWWLAFIYAIPVNAIVLLVFAAIWKYRAMNFLSVSIIIWMTITCCFLTVSVVARVKGFTEKIGSLWLIFMLGIPFQLLEIAWVSFRSIFRRNKKIKAMQPNAVVEEKEDAE